MGKKIIKFGDIDVEKDKFHRHKSSILVYDVDIKIVSSNQPFGKKGFKYFIGQKVAKKVRPLCNMHLKMSAYKRDFDETKYMLFL